MPDEQPEESTQKQKSATSQTTRRKKPAGAKRGCLLGCLGVSLVAFALVIAALAVGVVWTKRAVTVKQEMATTQPLNIVPYEPSQAELHDLRRRLDLLREGLTKGSGKTYQFRAEELNAMAAPLTRQLGLRSRVEIDGERLNGQLSIPVGVLTENAEGYLNAEYDVEISTKGGVLKVRFNQLTLNGQEFPKALLRRANTFIERAAQHKSVKQILSHATVVEVQDNVLRIVARDGKLRGDGLQLQIR